MAEVNVDWGLLMQNHPSYLTIGKYVKGIPEDWETCCIQMSYALNNAGAPIDSSAGPVDWISGGENYLIRVPTMRNYLNYKYGEAENYKAGSRIARISQIVDRTGILAFGDRHIDLWNRTQIQRPTDYIASAIWEAKSALSDGIYFWEVPSTTE